MAKTDWLPGKREDQLALAKRWVSELPNQYGRWKITDAEVDELKECVDDIETSQAKIAADGATKYLNARLKEEFERMVKYMRTIHKTKLFSPPMDDSDWIRLGLKPKDTIRTPIADPTGQAEADVTYPGPHLLMLHLKALEGTLIDPRADHGYRIYYGVMPTGGASVEEATGKKRYLTKAAATGEDLPHSKFSRKTKVLMEFDAADSGKTAYFSVRFENAKGGKGPWGPVFSATIP